MLPSFYHPYTSQPAPHSSIARKWARLLRHACRIPLHTQHSLLKRSGSCNIHGSCLESLGRLSLMTLFVLLEERKCSRIRKESASAAQSPCSVCNTESSA